MATFGVVDLQKLPETEPLLAYHEFGLSRCTVTCAHSCEFTCGAQSCRVTMISPGADFGHEVRYRRDISQPPIAGLRW